jgi:hypothetical protein
MAADNGRVIGRATSGSERTAVGPRRALCGDRHSSLSQSAQRVTGRDARGPYLPMGRFTSHSHRGPAFDECSRTGAPLARGEEKRKRRVQAALLIESASSTFNDGARWRAP